MELLKKRILKDGKIGKGDVLKVDSFLNHQVDVFLMEKIGIYFYEYFKNKKITKILTIESSGIAIGSAVARQFKIPLIFAKKSISKNIDGQVFESKVESYTKKLTYLIYVSKKFLKKNDNILLIDDFLANGSALLGLIEIVEKSKATIIGAGIVIEKSFQFGINRVRDRKIDVYSLVKIQSISNGKIIFKK